MCAACTASVTAKLQSAPGLPRQVGHPVGAAVTVLQGGLAGQPKILDFGVARILDTDVQTQRQTDLGQLIGTLAYT